MSRLCLHIGQTAHKTAGRLLRPAVMRPAVSKSVLPRGRERGGSTHLTVWAHNPPQGFNLPATAHSPLPFGFGARQLPVSATLGNASPPPQNTRRRLVGPSMIARDPPPTPAPSEGPLPEPPALAVWYRRAFECKDNAGGTQGPFTNAQMRQWGSRFPPDLVVSATGPDGKYFPIGECGGSFNFPGSSC